MSQKDLEMRGPGDLLGTRQSGEADPQSVFTGDTLLIEEVSRVVKLLHKDPNQEETRKALEQYARSYFESSGHEIALN